MRFSKRRKAKIHKNNQKRVSRVCKNMIGCSVSADNDNLKYWVVDQAKINGIMYLLTIDENGEFAIIKIVNVHLFVRLSSKKLLKTRLDFSKSSYWRRNSKIQISDNGIIKYISGRNQYDMNTFNNVHIFIEI